jgi:hypothetical protein
MYVPYGKKYQISFGQALGIVLFVKSSMLISQQYISDKVSLSRNAQKIRFCID